jgi:hypothetical protein
VTKLLAALVRADREYHDVILASVKDGKAEINDKTKPLLEIIAKYTNLPVEQVVGNCAYIDPDGKLDVKNVDNQIAWLQEQGFVDKGFAAGCDHREGICQGGLSGVLPLPLAGEVGSHRRCDPVGETLIHTNSVTRATPPTPALPPQAGEGAQWSKARQDKMDLIADQISHRFGALDVLDQGVVHRRFRRRWSRSSGPRAAARARCCRFWAGCCSRAREGPSCAAHRRPVVSIH